MCAIALLSLPFSVYIMFSWCDYCGCYSVIHHLIHGSGRCSCMACKPLFTPWYTGTVSFKVRWFPVMPSIAILRLGNVTNMDHSRQYSHSIQELMKNSWKTGYYDNWRQFKVLCYVSVISKGLLWIVYQSVLCSIFVSFISDHIRYHMSKNS